MNRVLVILATFFLIGCSSDDKDNPSPPVDNFISNINVNLQSFQPSDNADHLFTTFTSGINSGQANQRIFNLRQVDNGLNSGNASMSIVVTYPSTQTSINGSYTFSTSNLPSNSFASGQFETDSYIYNFKAGSVTITDLGSNNYKIEFYNAKIGPFGSLEIPVTGYFDGRFF